MREKQDEADIIGLHLAAAAGFDVETAPSILSALEDLQRKRIQQARSMESGYTLLCGKHARILRAFL